MNMIEKPRKAPAETSDPAGGTDQEWKRWRFRLAALRECRPRVTEFMARTGPRNPAYVGCESLVAYIEAVARLTRAPGAAKFIRRKPKEPGGKWPAGKPPDE